MVRPTASAAQIDVIRPSMSTTAKPRTGPVPSLYSTSEVMIAVTWLSTMVGSAFSKPSLMTCAGLLARSFSSRMRS
jgi:hypothetical protein